MRNDEEGVAGFFEDLPVLMLVLGGTMLLASSAVWTSERLAENGESAELNEVAERAVERVIGRLRALSPVLGAPTLDHIEGANLTESLTGPLGGKHFVLNISDLCHPDRWSVVVKTGCQGDLKDTGSARRLMNGLDGSGLVVVLEVRLIVWKA